MLGQYIRNKRLDRGLTQAQAAIELGIMRPTLSQWEKGTAIPQSRHSLINAWLNDRSQPPPSFTATLSIAAYEVKCGNCRKTWSVPKRVKSLYCPHCAALNKTGKPTLKRFDD